MLNKRTKMKIIFGLTAATLALTISIPHSGSISFTSAAKANEGGGGSDVFEQMGRRAVKRHKPAKLRGFGTFFKKKRKARRIKKRRRVIRKKRVRFNQAQPMLPWGTSPIASTMTSQEGNTTVTRITHKNGDLMVTRITKTTDPKDSTTEYVKTVIKKYDKGRRPAFEIIETNVETGLVIGLNRTLKAYSSRTRTYTTTKPRILIREVRETSRVIRVERGGIPIVEGKRTTKTKDLKTGKTTTVKEVMDPKTQQWGPAPK